MALSWEQFQATVKARAILNFPEPILKTPDPHYFICIGLSPDNELVLSCCTSQFETVKNLVERNRYPASTLVYIPKTHADNPFKKDTYINCNEYFQYTMGELWAMYNKGQLSFHGELPLDSFDQILTGFRDSDQIEDELKDTLPTIDDF